MQKLLNLVNEFSRDDCSENEARRAFVSVKKPIKADYSSFDHVSHDVNNFAINVSNYLTPDTKRAFDQLR